VEFPSHHIQLWLPESSSLYIAYRGRRYERIHTFSDFQLFSVDSAQADKQPPTRFFRSIPRAGRQLAMRSKGS